MNWSTFQLAIFEFLKQSMKSCFVSAVAGSGKTTVIVESLKHLTGRSGFCAFNKHIVMRLQGVVPEVFTLNALGWRASVKMFPALLRKEKVEKIVQSMLSVKDYNKYRSSVCRLVSLMKALYTDNIDLNRYDIDIPDENAITISKEVLKKSIAMTNVFDFDDQIYMPLKYDIALPQFDNLMVDESQDLSPSQIELITRVAKNRVIAVGDKRQSIYGFRGANPEAIKELIRRFNMEQLPLSISYRCPKLVVAEAKKIVPEIESWENAKDGRVDRINYIKFQELVDEKDFVLCRTTAPLVKSCLQFIRDGRQASVKGKEIGEFIINTISRIASDNISISSFIEKLEVFKSVEVSRLYVLKQDARAQALEDRLETICVLLEDGQLQFVFDLKNKVRSIFKEDAVGIQHFTIHKSKGLEAQRVFILRPDLLPFPRAKNDWQIEQEYNLKYVGITRAMDSLFWVG